MKRILVSQYGQKFGIGDDGSGIFAKGLRVGDFPKQMLQGSHLHTEVFDDFNGAAILGTWGLLKGSDAAAANFAVSAALDGTVLGSTGANAGVSMATNGVQISGHLNFQVNSPLNAATPSSGATSKTEFGCRLKLSAVTTMAIFVGFTNQVAALQMPIQGSGTGNAFTNNANDACGFLFDTAMSTPVWWGVGAKAGTSSAGQQGATAPVANTYDDMFFDVDATGNISYYLNGVLFGVLTPSAVTASVPLAPVVAAFRRSAASANISIDYLYAGMPRV
jgi:hypothetical protein